MRKKMNFKALVESIITDVFITIVIIILGSSFVYSSRILLAALYKLFPKTLFKKSNATEKTTIISAKM